MSTVLPKLRETVMVEMQREFFELLYDQRSQIAQRPGEIYLYHFCEDWVYRLHVWVDGDECEWGEGAELTQHDCRIYSLVEAAMRFNEAETILLAGGYPTSLVQKWVADAQKHYLHAFAKDSDTSYHYGIYLIQAVANGYRDVNPALPHVTVELGECGGPLASTQFVGEGLKKLQIIPMGAWKICRAVFKVDPDDFNACRSWRQPALGKPHDVAGLYLYKAFWRDGSVSSGRLDFDYINLDSLDRTVITR